MADNTGVVSGDSPQAVAFALLCAIAFKEEKASTYGSIHADKEWILSTYRECLSETMRE